MNAATDTGDTAAYSLLQSLEGVRDLARPPVHLWQPERETDIDLCIDRAGCWWHDGRRITRPRLVRLFASILRREGDEYFLVTPAEKCRIRVEDLPFRVVQLQERRQHGKHREPTLWFTTNMAEDFPLDAAHPLRLRDEDGAPRPCILVRDNLYGLLERSVWYQLAELVDADAASPGVQSGGCFFPLAEA